MSNADIKLCFKMIELETTKYEKFMNDGKYHLASYVLYSRVGMKLMLAALLGQPVEKLAEIRKLL